MYDNIDRKLFQCQYGTHYAAHIQRLSHVAQLEKANTFMQAFRKFQLKKFKFILLINVFLDVTVLNA